MTFLLYALPALLLYRMWNLGRVGNVKLKAQYELERVRFDLNLLMIDHKINSKNQQLYNFLNIAISNSEKLLDRLSMWFIVYTALTRQKQEQKPIEEIKMLEQELSKHPELKKLYDEYLQITYRYFIKKSVISIFLAKVMSRVFRILLKYHIKSVQSRQPAGPTLSNFAVIRGRVSQYITSCQLMMKYHLQVLNIR